MKIEIRNNQVVLDGYVNVVERESRVLPSVRGKFVETIKAKTFERALLKNDDVKMLFNHNEQRELGSMKQGNLELFEDAIGLRAIATITDEEVIEKAKNKQLRGWSFGFVAKKDTWLDGENGIQKRILEDIDLLEVSILDKTPAYIATSIEVRDENEVITEQRSEDFEAEITDLSTNTYEENNDNTDVPTENEEVRVFDYSILEKQIELLKLKRNGD